MRNYLTADLEIRQLLAPTGGQRYEARDNALLLLIQRHGLRGSEACGMLLHQVRLEPQQLQVVRVKIALSTTQSPRTDQLKGLKRRLGAHPGPTTHTGSQTSVRVPARAAACITLCGATASPRRSVPQSIHACDDVHTSLVRNHPVHRDVAGSSIYVPRRLRGRAGSARKLLGREEEWCVS